MCIKLELCGACEEGERQCFKGGTQLLAALVGGSGQMAGMVASLPAGAPPT
jgi:hypothetical protein